VKAKDQPVSKRHLSPGHETGKEAPNVNLFESNPRAVLDLALRRQCVGHEGPHNDAVGPADRGMGSQNSMRLGMFKPHQPVELVPVNAGQ
jgi:hypothetical protein